MPCGRPVASGPRSSSKRGDPSCCGGGSSRVSLFGFGAAPSSRLVGRSAWRLGDGGGNLGRTRCGGSGRGCRIGRIASRRGTWPRQPGQGIADQVRREAQEALPQAGEKRAAGQGRWARLRAAWRGIDGASAVLGLRCPGRDGDARTVSGMVAVRHLIDVLNKCRRAGGLRETRDRVNTARSSRARRIWQLPARERAISGVRAAGRTCSVVS
jgi:hypothetical protein